METMETVCTHQAYVGQLCEHAQAGAAAFRSQINGDQRVQSISYLLSKLLGLLHQRQLLLRSECQEFEPINLQTQDFSVGTLRSSP